MRSVDDIARAMPISPSTHPLPRPLLNNVQCLRAVAAFLVVFVHLDQLLAALNLVKFGAAGVDIFFVISGFIMVYTTQDRNVRPGAFLKNRLARIAPIYWFFTAAVFVVAWARPSLLQNTSADLIGLVKSLLFIPFEKGNGVYPLLFVGWTLNYEMFFYALFAVGLFAPNSRHGVLFTLGALAAVVVAGVLLQPTGVVAKFYTSPLLLEFGAGMVLGLLLGGAPYQQSRAVRVIAGSSFVVGLAAAVGAPLLWPHLPGLLSAGLPAVISVASAILLERHGWRVENRSLLLLGAASYSTYLVHPFVTQAFQKVGAGLDVEGPAAAVFILLALLAVGLAGITVHLCLERPLSKAADQFLGVGRALLRTRAPLPSSGGRS